jgi:PAS domain S-box-containing protein
MDKLKKCEENGQSRSINTNFDEIFYQSPIGILLYDKKGRLTNANNSALEIARIPKLEDVLDTNIFDNPSLDSRKEELHEKGLIKFQDSLDLIKIKKQHIYNPIQLKTIDIDWTVSITDSGYLIQIQDITEQKKIEKEKKSLLDNVQAERDMLSALINNIPDEIWFADKNKKFTLANPSALREFGLYSKDIDIEKFASNLDVYRPDGSPRPVDEAPPLRALKGENIKNLEEIVRIPPSKDLRYRQVNASPVKDNNDKIIGAVSVVRDITKSKKAEEALKEGKKKYSTLFERMNEGFTIAEMIYNNEGEPYDFRWIDMNRAYEEKIGFTRDTLLSTTARAMFPKLQPKLVENFGKVMLTGKQLQFENYNIELNKWFDVIAYKISRKHFAYLTLDITERKQTEKERNKLILEVMTKEEELSALIENIVDEVWFCDVEGNIILANAAARRFEKESELENLNSVDKMISHVEVFNADGSARSREESPMMRALNDEIVDIEDIVVFPSTGKKIYRQITAAPIKDNKKITGAVAVVRDITERKNAEKALKESEAKYRNIVEIANEGIMIADISGKINFVNVKMAEMLGYTIKELIGTDSTSLVDKNQLQLGLQKIENRKKGIQESYEIKYIRKSGEELCCLINATPMYDFNGKHVGNMTMQTDITERIKANDALKESESRFHSVLDNSQDIIYRMNVQTGRYEYISPSAENVVGYSPEELMALDTINSINMIHPDDRIVMQDAINNLDQTGNIEIEYRQRTKNGDYRWISNKMALIRDNTGRQLYSDGNMRDITKRKNIEEQMKTTMDELKRSNEELERFAYVSSHDLQEPLRMVTLYSQLLERRYKDNLDSDADDFIEYIVEGSNRMRQLIDDLLEYSRITSQTKEFENVGLEKVLDTVLHNLSISIVEYNVTISHDPLPTVSANQNQMLQVFQNLITNSIKFRGQNPPKIHISAQKDEKEWIFAVSDNGIGIKPEHQKQIFEVFKRLHTKEEYPGTGIGLSIIKKIILYHSGRIWVESELGKGSTFYFTIPFKK